MTLHSLAHILELNQHKYCSGHVKRVETQHSATLSSEVCRCTVLWFSRLEVNGHTAAYLDEVNIQGLTRDCLVDDVSHM